MVVSVLTPAEVLIAARWLAGARPHLAAVAGIVQALASERERAALTQTRLANALVTTPPCAVCGSPAARIELVAPGQDPAEWDQWPSTVQDSIVRQREPGQWYLLYQGVATYNGMTSTEILAPAAGILRDIATAENETAPAGTQLAMIKETQPAQQERSAQAIVSTTVIRRLVDPAPAGSPAPGDVS